MVLRRVPRTCQTGFWKLCDRGFVATRLDFTTYHIDTVESRRKLTSPFMRHLRRFRHGRRFWDTGGAELEQNALSYHAQERIEVDHCFDITASLIERVQIADVFIAMRNPSRRVNCASHSPRARSLMVCPCGQDRVWESLPHSNGCHTFWSSRKEGCLKTISCWNDLRPYGIDVLTGEACGLSYRFLCDVTEQGRKILARWLSMPELHLSDAWNRGNIADPHVGSILLAPEVLTGISVFALLETGCTECWLCRNGTVFGVELDDPSEQIAASKRMRADNIVRLFRSQGTAGDRNVHVMSGRIE